MYFPCAVMSASPTERAFSRSAETANSRSTGSGTGP
jgi:hypothetical protein